MALSVLFGNSFVCSCCSSVLNQSFSLVLFIRFCPRHRQQREGNSCVLCSVLRERCWFCLCCNCCYVLLSCGEMLLCLLCRGCHRKLECLLVLYHTRLCSYAVCLLLVLIKMWSADAAASSSCLSFWFAMCCDPCCDQFCCLEVRFGFGCRSVFVPQAPSFGRNRFWPRACAVIVAG